MSTPTQCSAHSLYESMSSPTKRSPGGSMQLLPIRINVFFMKPGENKSSNFQTLLSAPTASPELAGPASAPSLQLFSPSFSQYPTRLRDNNFRALNHHIDVVVVVVVVGHPAVRYCVACSQGTGSSQIANLWLAAGQSRPHCPTGLPPPGGIIVRRGGATADGSTGHAQWAANCRAEIFLLNRCSDLD